MQKISELHLISMAVETSGLDKRWKVGVSHCFQQLKPQHDWGLMYLVLQPVYSCFRKPTTSFFENENQLQLQFPVILAQTMTLENENTRHLLIKI